MEAMRQRLLIFDRAPRCSLLVRRDACRAAILRDGYTVGVYRTAMKLDIPVRQFGGYIFDCDGTIADTMPIHFRAWTQAMKDFGGQFPEELFYQWGGKPTAVIVEHLNETFGLTLQVEETVRRKESYYLEGVQDAEPIIPVLEIAMGMRRSEAASHCFGRASRTCRGDAQGARHSRDL